MLYFFQIFYICLKIWTQYSNLGLTSILYSFVIIFFDLHLIVLLISPSVEFAFLIAILHCSVNFILLSTMMPKSRSFIESLKSLAYCINYTYVSDCHFLNESL